VECTPVIPTLIRKQTSNQPDRKQFQVCEKRKKVRGMNFLDEGYLMPQKNPQQIPKQAPQQLAMMELSAIIGPGSLQRVAASEHKRR